MSSPIRQGNAIHMAAEATHERPLILSAQPAGKSERRSALAVVLLSTFSAAPFAKVRVAEVWAFLPVYQSVLVINDLVTAVLLFGQFGIVRSRALLVLASGYLFSAFMAVLHLLSFPALITSTGLLGAGSQTTAWLYFLWHGVFPLLVVAYALLDDGRASIPASEMPRGRASHAILLSIAAVTIVAGAFTLLTTMGHDALPAIMHGNRDAPAKIIVATASWTSSLHRARRPVATTAAFVARPVAYGRDVRMDLRYRAGLGAQCGSFRRRLVRRPNLWTAGDKFHSHGLAV
jgi:hypothetical protein